jgi:RNA polymerase sigma-70 factor (ECF subfamily)
VDSDAVLAARVAHGDLTAFGELYERYARPVYALAAHALGRSDAEEVVQDVFVRLWRKAAQFDPERGSFPAWLMTIAQRRVFDELRRRPEQRRAAEAIDTVLADAPDPAPPFDEHTLNGELVLHALKQVPPEQRRALVLAYFGGLTHEEVAAATGWPLGTVKKRLRLGLDKLRAGLADEAREPAAKGTAL